MVASCRGAICGGVAEYLHRADSVRFDSLAQDLALSLPHFPPHPGIASAASANATADGNSDDAGNADAGNVGAVVGPGADAAAGIADGDSLTSMTFAFSDRWVPHPTLYQLAV